MEIESLTLNKVGFFQQAHLEIPTGLTVISGRNEDADPASGKDTARSNGAGKSMLVMALAEVLCDANPVLKGAGVSKDLFGDKEARGTVQFSSNGRTFRATKSRKGASVKYDIERLVGTEWKQPKIRTDAYAKELLWRECPITQEEFFTFFYIDSRRLEAFQLGTLQARAAFLASAYRLEYGAILDHVKARLKVTAPEETTRANLCGELVSAEKELEDLAVDDESLASLDDLKKKQVQFTNKQAKLQAIFRMTGVLSTCRPAVKRIVQTLNVMFAERMSEDDFFQEFDGNRLVELRDSANQALKKARNTLKQWATANEDVARRAVLQKQLEAAEKELATAAVFLPCGEAGILRKPAKLIKNLEAYRDTCTAQEDYLAKYEYEVARLSTECDSLKVTKADLKEFAELADIDAKQLRKELAQAEGSLAVFERDYKKLASLSGKEGQCPTCLQELDAKLVRSMLADLAKSMKKAQATLTDLEESDAKLDRRRTLEQRLEKYDSVQEQLKEITSLPPEKPAHTSKEVSSCIRLAQRVLDLKAEMEELSDIDEKVVDADKLQTKVDRLTTLLTDLDLLRPHLASLKDMWQYADEDADEIEEKLRNLSKRIERNSAEISRLQASVGVYERIKARIESLQQRIQECEDKLVDLPALQALKMAYSDSGLKSFTLARLCARIEENMNLYAPLLFAEPIKFNVFMSNANMHVTCTRTFKKKEVTVDVRRLSGAESASFNLLFPLANLPLVSAARRLDLMVLDEPLAHLDEPARVMFVEKFLPLLLKIVPKVIILSPTPLPYLPMPSNNLLVRRSKGVSTLEKVP